MAGIQKRVVTIGEIYLTKHAGLDLLYHYLNILSLATKLYFFINVKH
jgi:hypothetical protein